MDDELNLATYTAAHRTRRHGMENGTVKKTGKHVKKWIGHYHDYRTGPNGKTKRIRLSTTLGPVSEMTKAEAQEALRVFIRRRYAQPAAETTKATVGTLCDDYLQLHEGDWEEATLATNTSILKLIKAGLGDRVIEEVQPEEVKLFINSLPRRTWKTPTGQTRTGCSESQGKKCITYVRAIFDLAVGRAAKRGVLFLNPAKSKEAPLSLPKGCRTPDKKILPPEELLRLMQHLDERDQLVVWLAAVSPRPSEIFAIRVSAVGPGYIFIENSLSRRRELKDTKTSNRKFIALPETLDGRVRRWIEERCSGPDDFLFVNKVGKPMIVKNFLNRNLRGAARRAGIKTLDVDFQMLRRSFATIAWHISRDVKSLQSQMRHEKPDMFLRDYAQPLDDATRLLVQRFENVVLGKEAMPVELAMKLGGSRLVQ